MSEQGLIIQSFPSGLSVAARSAIEEDVDSNERVIQRFDFSSGKFLTGFDAALRSSVSDDDGFTVSSFPTGVESNLITVGDKSLLCAFVEFTDVTDLTSVSLELTPVIYSNDSTPAFIAPLTTKTIELTIASAFVKSSSIPTVSEILTWDVMGAYKIGIVMNNYSETGNSLPVNIYGTVI